MKFKKWIESLIEPLQETVGNLGSYLPDILKAILLLIIGWLVAFSLRALTKRIVSRMRGLVERQSMLNVESDSGIDWLASDLIARIVFWMVFLVFLAAATDALRLQVFTGVLSQLIHYLPTVLAAVFIFLTGWILSSLAQAGIQSATSSANIGHGKFMGQVARFFILLVTSVIVLDQIGVDSTLLIVITSILIAAIIGGAALAFGMGARTAVSNIIATHYVTQAYSVGQGVKIGSITGKIIEFKTTSVLLDTSEGLTLVPSAEFSEKASVLLDQVT